MDFIGKIIIIGIFLFVGYGFLREYFGNEDSRPVYHIFIRFVIVLGIVAVLIKACGD